MSSGDLPDGRISPAVDRKVATFARSIKISSNLELTSELSNERTVSKTSGRIVYRPSILTTWMPIFLLVPLAARDLIELNARLVIELAV